jgi:AcrR family transcriptional regulator
VLAAARELVRTGELSMRTLARRLDVAPNALYSHVKDKTDLLDQLLDDTLSAVAAPAGRPPRAGVETMMTSTYDTLTAHPELVLLFLQRQGARGPHAVALGEVLDDQLGRLGVADVTAARRVLIVHAIGFAAFATTGEDGDPTATRAGFVRSLGWLLDGMTKAPPEEGGAFATG